jgi:hypothetical protein
MEMGKESFRVGWKRCADGGVHEKLGDGCVRGSFALDEPYGDG